MTGHNTHWYGANRVVATDSLGIRFTAKYTEIAGQQARVIVPTVEVGAGLAGYKA